MIIRFRRRWGVKGPKRAPLPVAERPPERGGGVEKMDGMAFYGMPSRLRVAVSDIL